MRNRTLFLWVVLLVSWALLPAAAQEAATLTPGTPVERTITGGQTHVFRLPLQAGQFVHFEVQQTSCDVALTLTTPDGKKMDANFTPFGLPEMLSQEVATAGEYQLTLRSLDYPKMSGSYRLQVTVKATADASDKKRLQAESLLLELRTNLPPAQRLEKAHQLRTLWHELGERFGEGHANALLANAYSQQANLAKAIEHTEIAVATMRELKLRAGEAFYLYSLATYQDRNRQGDQAIATAQQAVALARTINARRLIAMGLDALGDYFVNREQYEQALGCYEQSHALMIELGNTDYEVWFPSNKGLIARRQKKYEEAQKHYEAALTKAQEQNKTLIEIQLCLDLGDIAQAQRQSANAIRNYEQAVSLARTIGNRSRELDSLLKLAFHHKYFGTVPDKNRANLAALPLAQELKRYAALSDILGNLGDGSENLEKRLRYYEQSLAATRQTGNKKVEADNLQGICLTQIAMGNIEKGIVSCEQAMAVARESGFLGAETSALRHLGDAYAKLFQYEKALSYFQEALATAQKYDRRAGETAGYAELAAFYFFLGQNDKAQELIEKALQIPAIRRTSSEFLCLRVLGQIYLVKKQPEKAIETHEKLLANMKEWAPDGMGMVGANLELGRDYVMLGQYDKAQPYFEAAAQMLVRINEPTFFSQVQLGFGNVWRGLQQYDKALVSHQQALLLSRQYPTGTPYEAPYHEQLMRDWRALGNPSLAIFFGKQAVNANQDVRFNLRNLEKDIQQSFLQSKEQTYRELADLLITQGRLPEAEQVIRMLKEEEFFEYVRRDGQNGAKTEKAALTPEEAALDKRYREIAEQLTTIGSERGTLLEKKERTAEENQRLAKLEADLSIAAQQFQRFLDGLAKEMTQSKDAIVRYSQVSDAQGLQADLRELGKGVAALYTVVGEDKYSVILTTADVQKAYQVPIKAAELNRKVLAFRDVLQNPKLDPLPLAQELYRILLAPVAKDLRAMKATTLMWSLDGVLRYVPMTALHDGERYLVESYRQAVFTPVSNARLKDVPSRHWQALGLGVTKAHGPTIPALPGVAEEMRGIIKAEGSPSGILPGTIKLDEQFTQEAMLAGLREQKTVVHVASHFQFKPGNETDSALLLGDGKFLSLAQIKALPNPFSGVELLTLSACNTATGGVGANGNEVEGFGALAQKKGAKAVVASLWPVADRSTKSLMQEFYRRREARADITKVEALRQAQLQLLRGELVTTVDVTKREIVHETDTAKPTFKPDPKKPYAHPYYWAPFILIGNWK